jgi:hypothetical protein
MNGLGATKRKRVDIDGYISTETTFNISVIQGSILGPILFLIYINNLYNATKRYMLQNGTFFILY